MSCKGGVPDCHVGTVADTDKATIGSTMITFAGDTVFQSFHKYIRSIDHYTPVVVGIFRRLPVGNGSESTACDGAFRLVDREGSDLRNLVKIPDDGCVLVHVVIFVHNKYIRLRRSVVLIRSKPDISSDVGIGDGEKAGSGKWGIDLVLIPFQERYTLGFERL